ncbi:hypothetical protein GALMADRAFT_156041 [Galerina marginata CBS 339.88]|uniref:Uncharacterized protein n=1 Tax=Galerina marginata (strain CBS 339.88) TaxID=685588 RepID=A0A067T2J0_GALM3|nr:hypothetical protein GALMADRAFT_156041 [Galerina marginata CBS 339.88]
MGVVPTPHKDTTLLYEGAQDERAGAGSLIAVTLKTAMQAMQAMRTMMIDASKMTEGDAQQMLDDDVLCPWMQALFSSLIAVAASQVRRLHSPPRQNQRGCSLIKGNSSSEDDDDDKDPSARVSISSQKSKKSTKSTQRISKCDAALHGELHPRVLKKRSSTVKVESDEDKTTLEETWPRALRLSAGALTQQTDLIHAVCRDSIRVVETTLVMQHAWPKLHRGALYKRHVLLDAVKSLQAKNTEDDEGKQEKEYNVLQTAL